MTGSTSLAVLIPVYNGKAFLQQALDSIFAQSDVVFDLIIIDDGSIDSSIEDLADFEGRSVCIYRQSNRGLAATLNRGLELASSNYIARQDQDDLMLPGRLAKQVEFLDKHPDYAMVGTWSQIWVGEKPSQRGHFHPGSHEALRLELLFDNPFVHSSVMLRADAARRVGGYSEDKMRQPPEDYEFWSRIAREYRIANIPEVLTVYREVEGSMSRTGENPFLNNVIRISSENLMAVLSPEFSSEECIALASLYHGRLSPDKRKILSRGRALDMHKQAALSLGGDRALWSEEFSASFQRQHLHITSQFIRRRLPSVLIGPARKIKQFVMARMSGLPKGL
ncbi:MAG: glycosyltransferase [Azonexus sp.]|nr:glycosyltransferase [Azonexus sp.]